MKSKLKKSFDGLVPSEFKFHFLLVNLLIFRSVEIHMFKEAFFVILEGFVPDGVKGILANSFEGFHFPGKAGSARLC